MSLAPPTRSAVTIATPRQHGRWSVVRHLELEARHRQVEIERVAAALPAGPLLVGGDLNSGTFNARRAGSDHRPVVADLILRQG